MKKTKRILIVEDAPDMLYIYRSIFDRYKGKYEIELENDAREAFKEMKKKRFDMVILDMMMAPMDGETFHAIVRDDPDTKRVPIVIVSVLHPEDLVHLKKFNHITILRKPIAEERLMKEVKKIIG